MKVHIVPSGLRILHTDAAAYDDSPLRAIASNTDSICFMSFAGSRSGLPICAVVQGWAVSVRRYPACAQRAELVRVAESGRRCRSGVGIVAVEKVGAGAFKEDLEAWYRGRDHAVSHAYLEIDHSWDEIVRIVVGFGKAS